MGELEDAYFASAEVAAPEELPEGVDEQEWLEWQGDYEQALAEQFEEEPEPDEQQIDPLEYPDVQAGPVEEQIGEQMRRQAWDEAYRDDLSDYVREVASSSEFGIRDEAAIARVTQEIMGARQELFRGWLGQGASVAQALQAIENVNIEAAAEVALRAEKTHAFGNGDPSLRSWRAGREQQARRDASEGVTRPDYTDSPHWQRMNAAAMAYAQRAMERQEQLRAVVDRQVYKGQARR